MPSERPGLATRLLLPWLVRLLPHADRDEFVADLLEARARRRPHGWWAAEIWACRQICRSLVPLVHRALWRAQTGFEPDTHRWRTGGPVFERWMVDVRYSLRRLTARPGYALLVVLTLALATAGAAASVGTVHAVLLRPLPVHDERTLASLWAAGAWTPQEFREMRPHFAGFSDVGAYMPGDLTLERPGAPLRALRGVATSANLFQVLGVHAALGRTFVEGEDAPGAAPAALLSHRLWRQLGGRADVVGSTLRLGGQDRLVVGVMPPGFWFPSPATDVWTAASLDPADQNGNLSLVGRLAPGMTLGALHAPLTMLAQELGRRYDYPQGWDKAQAPGATPLRRALVGDARAAVLASLGATVLLLALACVNVGAVMLAQVAGRREELAIRAALGADRARLGQQVWIEALVLGMLAGTLGAAAAMVGTRLLRHALPLGTIGDVVAVDWRIFAVAVATGVLTTVLAASVPLAALRRRGLASRLGTRGEVAPSAGRADRLLVVTQVALAFVLAVSAAVLLRGVAHLRAIDPGVRVEGVALIDVTLPVHLPVPVRQQRLFAVLPVLEALPGVEAVAVAQRLPLHGSGDNFGMDVQGMPAFQNSSSAFRTITVDYFKALGIPLRAGRLFTAHDRASAERVVIVNEAFAAKYFPGEDAIGRQLVTFDEAGERIVGIVGNVAEETLTGGSIPVRYMLYDQVPVMLPIATVVVRGAREADVPALLAAGRERLSRSGMVAVEQTRSMSAVMDDALGLTGRLSGLFAAVSGLGLLLGAVGVYGLLAQRVHLRIREYGIRMAVGLTPGRLMADVLLRGLLLVGAGLGVGLVGAFVATRWMGVLVENVDVRDPVAFIAATALLVAAGLLAAALPARRARRANPADVLRPQ